MKFLLKVYAGRRRFSAGETSEGVVSKDYIDFVNSVTSDPSKSQIDFVDALMILEELLKFIINYTIISQF